MSAILNPYLNFRGDARSALEFYKEVFGGDLTVGTFAEFGMPVDPAEADQVMHGQLTTASGFTLMASDVPAAMPWRQGDNAFSVSLSGDSADELTGYWERLAEGAEIQEPLAEAPWGDLFGMLRDRFGVSWLVNVAGGGGSAA
ncbi:VOC family protein [Amnibacterium endophyticum]|uniref:VOC family protein n=1 Tax=Amnibacterium endophyticum TaxID=2109337 RepID=A0ABW4LCS4_9MICO